MPRKVKSNATTTQDDKTSLRRATGSKRTAGARKPEIRDGGKWAGSGRKTVERGEGPAIQQQPSTGRGRKTAKVRRAGGGGA